jgi:hypothetical protein
MNDENHAHTCGQLWLTPVLLVFGQSEIDVDKEKKYDCRVHAAESSANSIRQRIHHVLVATVDFSFFLLVIE